MATGPLIQTVTPGAALSATEIANNFAAIQAFIASIPVDNLNNYKANHAHCWAYPTQAAGTTRDVGYTVADGGTFAAEPVLFVVAIQLAAALAVNDIVVSVQKTSTDITSVNASAAVWSAIGTVTFNATNTAAGYRSNFSGGNFWVVQKATLAAQTLEDAYGLRLHVVNGADASCTFVELNATLWSRLRLRG